MRSEIDPATLNAVLRYDAESGHLYWRERPESMFADTPIRSKSRNAAWWNGRFAGKRACKPDANKGYLRVGVFGNEYPAHRIIWAMHSGRWPVGGLDHIDGAKANNRLENLRQATTSENNRNRTAFGRSKYRGVSWRSGQSCWVAAIKVGGKAAFLGTFKDEEAAARAYDAAAIAHYGEFANPNFPQADFDQRIRSALA